MNCNKERLENEVNYVLGIIKDSKEGGDIYQGIKKAVDVVSTGLLKNHPEWRTYEDYRQWSIETAKRQHTNLIPMQMFCLALERAAVSEQWYTTLAGNYSLQGVNSVFRVTFYQGITNALKTKLQPIQDTENPFTLKEPKRKTLKTLGKIGKFTIVTPFKILTVILESIGDAFWLFLQVLWMIIKVLWVIGTVLCIFDYIHRLYIANTIADALKNL